MNRASSPSSQKSLTRESRSTSPSRPSSTTPSGRRTVRWTEEEEEDLKQTVREHGGAAKTEADWDRVRANLKTEAKERSTTAIKARYRAISNVPKKKQKVMVVKEEAVDDLEVGGESSQTQEDSFYSTQSHGGLSLPLSQSQEELRRTASPFASQTQPSNQVQPPLDNWTIAEDAALLSTLICGYPTLSNWQEVRAATSRTYRMVEINGKFTRTHEDCAKRYYTVLKHVKIHPTDFAGQTVSAIEYHNHHREGLSQLAFGHSSAQPSGSRQSVQFVRNSHSSNLAFNQTLAPPPPPPSSPVITFREKSQTSINDTTNFLRDPSPASSTAGGRAIPPFINRSSFVLRDPHLPSATDTNRRHSFPSHLTEDSTVALAPRRQSISGSLAIPQLESTDHPHLVSAPHHSVPTPFNAANSTSASSSSSEYSREPNLPPFSSSSSSFQRNPQRLLTPQDPSELERFSSPLIVPSTSIPASKLPTSQPLVTGTRLDLSSSFPPSPVSPELSRGIRPLPHDNDTFHPSLPPPSQQSETPRAQNKTSQLLPLSTPTSRDASGSPEAAMMETGTGLGLFLDGEETNADSGEGEKDTILRGIKRELQEFGGTGATGIQNGGANNLGGGGIDEGFEQRLKRRKVEFAAGRAE